MIFISKLVLSNWQCFRGKHVLKLTRGVYAIVARYEADPDGSNAAGKTSILEAIEFALYGQHRWTYEDEWITDGEEEGFVRLELNNGIVIERRRRRGKSTSLLVESGELELVRDEAQLFIESNIGLSNRDFRASSYLRQKHHSLFVTGDPADRRAMISEWFDLEKLIAAEKFARGKADVAERNAMSSDLLIRSAEGAARALVSADSKDVFADLSLLRSKEVANLEALEAEKIILQQRVDLWKERRARYTAFLAVTKRYEEIVAKGQAMRAEVERLAPMQEKLLINLENAKNSCDEMVERQKEFGRERTRLFKLHQEGFDGTCPITKGECPAREHVNTCRDSVKKQLEEADKAYKAVVEKQTKWMGIYNEALKERTHYTGLVDDLNRLREQAKSYKSESVEDPGPPPPLDYTMKMMEISEANQRLGRYDGVLSREAEYRQALATRDTSFKMAAQWRKVTMLFGKNGAQRRVAEEFLRSIADRANEILRLSNIDLLIDITWAREGTGLADECDACGSRFSSKHERACEKCGAARGPKIIQKLEVDLSDRSGALEDLGGIAIQMAASEWLRLARGSQWNVLMLDEPFGALDKTNRLAMSTTITKMLSGWDQAFVISHNPDTALSMPNRIEIIAAEQGSKVTVLK